MSTRYKKSRKTHTGVVPWPAVLAPGDEVAKVIGKPPLILFIIELNVSKGDLLGERVTRGDKKKFGLITRAGKKRKL